MISLLAEMTRDDKFFRDIVLPIVLPSIVFVFLMWVGIDTWLYRRRSRVQHGSSQRTGASNG